VPTWVHGVALVALAAVKAITAACAAEGALHPRAKRYRGKAMRVRAVGYAAGLSLVPAVWVAQRAQRPYPAGADLAVSVPLLIDATGNTLGIYDDARLDDLVHGVNAASLASLFGAVVSPHVRSRQQATLATIAFGVAGELGWEVMEYTAEALGFKGLGLSENDTISDVVAAFIGTGVAAGITWIRWRPTPAQPLADWGEPSPSEVAASEVQPPDLSASFHADKGADRSAETSSLEASAAETSPAETTSAEVNAAETSSAEISSGKPAPRKPIRRRSAAAPERDEDPPRSPPPGPPRVSAGGRRSRRRDS
jgi:hypothetical protein